MNESSKEILQLSKLIGEVDFELTECESSLIDRSKSLRQFIMQGLHNEHVVAEMRFFRFKEIYHVHDFFVAHQFQRKNIGTQLFKKLELFGIDAGIEKIFVNLIDVSLIDFFTKNGFSIESIVHHYAQEHSFIVVGKRIYSNSDQLITPFYRKNLADNLDGGLRLD